MKYGLPMYIDL